MYPKIAFFPPNPKYDKFFSLVAKKLKNDYGISPLFIREIGEIEDHDVFEFEKELERIWGEIDISNDALDKLVAKYPDFNFMRAIYSEREFNYFPFYYRNKPVTYDHQLKYLVGCFIIFEAWLDRVGIDIIVSELLTGMADAVLKEVAEKKGIKFYSVRQSKMTPGIVICDKYYDEPVGMRENYKLFVANGIPENIKNKAIEHIEELREKIQKPSYMELTKKPFKLITTSKLINLFKTLSGKKIPVNSVSANRHPLKNAIKWSLYRKWNLRRTRHYKNKWFAKDLGENERYFVYPLHYEPESSTLVRGFYFSDQLALIKLIAKLLPLGVKLVVKEHSGNPGYRKPDFYRELSYIPNVILLVPSYDVSSLIAKTIGIITLTGRMGWEAIANNKKVIALGESFWTSFDSVYYVKSWEELSGAIKECCREAGSKDLNNEKYLLSFASSYIQCIHNGSFVLNGKLFTSNDNIDRFCDLLISVILKKPDATTSHIAGRGN